MTVKEGRVELVSQLRSVMCLGTSKKFPNTIFAGLYPGFAAATHQGITGRQLTFTAKKQFPEIKHPIYRIVGDSKGDLWLSSDLNGIYHIRFNSSSLDDYQLFHYHTDHGLPGKPNNFVQLVNDQVLAATPKGIYRAVIHKPTPTNPSGVRFVPETTFGKMFHEKSIGVSRIYRDTKDRIWIISSDAGVGYMTKNPDNTYAWHNKPFKKLSKKTISEFFIEADGVAWFCTNEGIFRYDPTLKKDFEQPFNLNIRRATIQGDTDIFRGTYYSPISRIGDHYQRSSMLQPEELIKELPYKYNSIAFEFSAAHYEHIPSIRYRYKLEGFDQDWSQWTAETKKEYTNLDNGYYSFKVMARNVFETNSRMATYDFSIAPPWYKTTLAIILFSLLILLIIYGIVWFNSRRLVAAKKKLEEIVHERTARIEAQAEELKIAKEIAEREREIADAANQSKSEFLARMSHEIRTPMNGVIGFSEMLMDTELSEDQLDYARTIARSGEALLSILNDILDFSKIEAGELTFDPIEFDPEITAFDVCHLILPRVGDKEIEVICRVGDHVPGYIKTDPGRFRQVLINLMGNAAKFTEMGEIELALVVEKEETERLLLHITVRDTGIGIPAGKLESIFNVFQQADGSTTRKYGGSGLGLAICRQIAKLMEGNVWAESAEGKGSTFHFTCWVGKSAKKHPRIFKDDLLTNKRALILDDNKNNREFLAHVLEREGMVVISLGDPTTVISTLTEYHNNNEPFDICILDIQMPGTSGFDLAEEIRRLPDSRGKLPLLAFTSSTLSRSKKYKESGFDGFLPKPVRRQKLIQMVARLMGLEINESEPEKDEIVTRYSIEEEAKHRIHILLVEDNDLNLKLAKYMLTKAGYQLSVAKNGREAVKTYSAHPDRYHIILMDIQMPLMDGREATRQLRQKGFTDVPIIAMTAESMDGDRQRCLDAGMNDYISKPIKREIVYEIVKKWCLE
jgi:signal transduction histidine kinase/DNA-binding response OmpR family regulator